MEKTKNDLGKNVTRTTIIWIIISAFLFFIFLYILLCKSSFNFLVDSFNKIAVGLAALMAVIFGPEIVSEERARDRRIKEFIQRYPYKDFGKEWEIIESEKYPGAVYLFDKKSQTKHHILNMKTVYDLGWHIFWNKIKKIKDKKFQQYNIGERIRTQGEAGE